MHNALFALLHRMTTAVGRARDQAIEQELHLSASEWRVLMTIAAHAPISTKAISEMSGIDMASASRAGTTLVDRQLVNRGENPKDKRLVSLTLTDPGRTTCQRIVTALNVWDDSFESVLSQQSQKALSQLFTHRERLVSETSFPE